MWRRQRPSHELADRAGPASSCESLHLRVSVTASAARAARRAGQSGSRRWLASRSSSRAHATPIGVPAREPQIAVKAGPQPRWRGDKKKKSGTSANRPAEDPARPWRMIRNPNAARPDDRLDHEAPAHDHELHARDDAVSVFRAAATPPGRLSLPPDRSRTSAPARARQRTAPRAAGGPDAPSTP